MTNSLGTTGSAQWPRPARHTDASDFLALDGHVKWLRGIMVSPGLDNSSATGAEGAGGFGVAAGTSNSRYVMTFSRN